MALEKAVFSFLPLVFCFQSQNNRRVPIGEKLSQDRAPLARSYSTIIRAGAVFMIMIIFVNDYLGTRARARIRPMGIDMMDNNRDPLEEHGRFMSESRVELSCHYSPL